MVFLGISKRLLFERLGGAVMGTPDARPLPTRLEDLERGFGRVELELEDLVGADGDILDLHMRLEQLEKLLLPHGELRQPQLLRLAQSLQ